MRFPWALLNLALNARDAMAEGGQLDIAARRASASRPRPLEVTELGDGEYVCITCADTGSGMDEATIKRATEPFFTTKRVGKGTGLGLSMVHGLAAQSGGAMRIATRLGAGTTVLLWLPMDRAATARPDVSAEPRQSHALSCRVLVVDDDALISASTAAMLEDLGHVVIEASSGACALDVMRLGATVDLVITDQVMPGMTGLDLAQHMRQGWPGIPVVLASGYADMPDAGNFSVPRLAKPYQQAELAACLTRGGGCSSAPPRLRCR